MNLIARVMKLLRAGVSSRIPRLPGGHKSTDTALTLGDLSSDEAQDGANLFDITDERVISAELAGRMDLSRYFVYAFRSRDQKDVVGMGIKGTQALYRKCYRAGPSVAPGAPQYFESEYDYPAGGGKTANKIQRVRCQTIIINPITKEHTPGVSTADSAMWVWDYDYNSGKRKDTGRWEEDKFYYQKALTKATRNAMQFQIDPILLMDWLFRWLREKRVLQLDLTNQKAMAKGGAIESDRLGLFRKRIFSIAETGGMDMSGDETPDKQALRAWVKKWLKKNISDINDADEMRSLGNLLMDTHLKLGDKFPEHIRAGGAPVIPAR